MGQLQVELVAADRMVWNGEAKQISARGIEGDLGILPGHQPFLTALVEGDVRITGSAGDEQTAHVDGGFLSVDHDRVTIVADVVTTASSGRR